MKCLIRFALTLCCLIGPTAFAATYNLSNGQYPDCIDASNGNKLGWTVSGTTYSCGFGRVVLGSGDQLTSSGNITIKADNGFIMASNTIGATGKTIALVSSYGPITAAGTNVIYGNLQESSGAINLANTTLTGTISSGSGSVTLTNTSVSGAINGTGNGSFTNSRITGAVSLSNGVTSNSAIFESTVTADGGSISLTGGSVAGLVKTNCCGVTTNGTNLSGGVTANNDTSLTGGTISGTLRLTANNTLSLTNATMTSGSINAFNVGLQGSTLGSSGNSITVTANGNTLDLKGSTVYGYLTVNNTYGKINIDSGSHVYGTCKAESTPNTNNNVNGICGETPPPVQTCLTDNFNRTDLGSNWSVAYSSGSFGNPRITNNRLRLTDNAAYNATAATFLMTTPGAGNKITTTFKYYAYGGNNADGVVLTFSDATVTPQPGGYGGSLGYATVSGNNKGFAGGWLGVALDEYGNFSNPTETRKGGPGFTPQAVVIRGSGSGSTGYNYLQGTKTLSPKLDQSGSAAGPGHTYRVTLDTTTAGKALVTVERDTGSGFTPVITSFDALASSSQAAVPTNFYLTFTSSTGGQNNNHEIDDFQVCANKFNEATYPIDHFEFQYSDNALTCTPLPVKIRACVDAACSVEYSKPVTVTLSPANFWVGGTGRTVTFTGNASLQFRNPDVNTKAIGVESSSVQTRPVSQPVCSTAKCEIAFRDAGFIFDVPDMVAGKTVDVSAQAVRKDQETQSCAPALANVTRDVRFYGVYNQPNTGTMAIDVEGSKVTMVSNGASAPNENARTKVSLKFDDKAKTNFKVTYPDAGKMALSMAYFGKEATGDSYLQIGERNGDGHSRDGFLSKPYGLCVQTAATCTAADVDCPAFPNVRAGDFFDLTVKAVGWKDSDKPLTAEGLCKNPITPNFALTGINLALELNAPVGGAPGKLESASYDHAIGNATTVKQSLSEVGVFSITATPGLYHGATVSGGKSAMIGRMTPAYLDVSGAGTLTPSCTAFSYQGQPMSFASGKHPILAVTGKNRQKQTTENYDRGSFWRLEPPTSSSYQSVTGRSSIDADGRLEVKGKGAWASVAKDENNGDGMQRFERPGETLTYLQKTLPVADDLPFAAKAQLPFSKAALRDQDGVCFEGPDGKGTACRGFDLPVSGSEIRLGRLSIANASGSELQALELPWRVESWQSISGTSAFGLEPGDLCSKPMLGSPTLADAQGNLGVPDTSVSLISTNQQEGTLRLTAPGRGNDGSVRASFPSLHSWLFYDWQGNGSLTGASGLATFGIYSGSPPLIFRREVYR